MFNKDKIALATKVMQEQGIDSWIITGHESPVNSEPVLDLICDHEFIGYTALIFNSDGSNYCVCTPIDKNGYVHSGIFDHVEGFEVSYEASISEYLKVKKPKVVALNYSENDVQCDGLSYGVLTYLEEAFKLSGISYEFVSALPIVSQIKEG